MTPRITSAWIREKKAAGLSPDLIYQEAAGTLGLFGVAFFGHKTSPRNRARLRRTWQRIVKICQT